MNEDLRKFLLSENDLLPLKKWTNSINIFNIISNAKTEIRHSKMLAWLFNVNENHGLGDAFVRRFIMSVIEENEERKECPEIEDWAFLNYDNQVVETEKNNIDICIRFESEDQKSIVVIENKTRSTEHDAGKSNEKQTVVYRERIEKEYADYKKMFVYLTPDGASCADDTWCLLTYDSVLDNITAITSQFKMSPYVEMILQNYCSILRSDIIADDPELNNACELIYQKHKQAINLLAESRKSEPNLDAEALNDCNRIYSKYQKELDLIFANTTDEKAKLAKMLSSFNWMDAKLDKKASGRTYVRFTIPELDKKIPLLKEANGSWNTQHTYYFWFGTYNFNKINKNNNQNERKVNFVFELGLKNTTEEIKEKHNLLIEKFCKNSKTGKKYKRLKSIVIDVDKESTLEEIVAKVFDVAKDNAQKWYKNIEKAFG